MVPPRQVVVAGGEISQFGRFPDQLIEDLAVPTIAGALRAAALDIGDLEAAFVGNAFGGVLHGQETILGQVLLRPSGITGLPVHNVKNACSSGADAVHLAWSTIAFGQYDCVLVLGAEKMTHPDHKRTMVALASAADRHPVDARRSVFMDINAERAQRYMHEYGATPRHFAMCAVKNRIHAALNERAAVRSSLTVDQVLSDRIVAAPLTRAMCGGIADGAACLILTSASFARKRSLSGPIIKSSVVVSGEPAGSRGSKATERAAARAFEQAGIGASEVSLAEVHDPTAPQELFDIEDIGFCPRGGAIRLIEDKATSLGGSLPVNVSGGLTCRGHPVGATGVAQIVEIAEQLRGVAGRRQVEGARVGLAQMAGGILGQDSAVAAVHILTT